MLTREFAMEKLKELVGRKVVEYIQDGMIVGLGSGSTAACAIRSLGERVDRKSVV